jgi:protein involved in polysaccharide export with SLBB domain
MSLNCGSHGETGMTPIHMFFKHPFTNLSLVLATCFTPVWAQSLSDKNSLNTVRPAKGVLQTNTGAPNSTIKSTDAAKTPVNTPSQSKTQNRNSLKPTNLDIETPTPNTIKDNTLNDNALKDNIPLAPETEFQRFVLSTSGQSLPLFGYELFESKDLFQPVEAVAVPPSYVLSPGDELVIQINGLMEVNERLVIDREGRILLPKIGPVHMAGVVLKDAERVLGNHVAKMYRNFSVSVSMGRLRSIEIFVVGQAKKPGKHMVSSLSSLINALFETGGPGVNGSLRAVTLKRQGKVIATVDMYAFLSQGDNSKDMPLMTGDLIYIPPAGARVALLGSVNTPAVYELLGSETIGHMLSLSGGLPALAAPQQAQLERVDTRRPVARYVEDVALDDSGLNQRMQAGDVLTVLQISPQIDNAVTLTGNVDTPLRYSYKPGMMVADVLKDKRLLIAGTYWEELNKGVFSNKYSRPEVNLDYATVQRLDKHSLRTVLLPFNLLKAITNDPQENLALQKGDVVKVYGPQDLLPETDNSVSVTGEIVGGTKRFVWRPGFTIKDVIPSTQWLVDYYGYWQREFARDFYNDINWDYAVVNRRVPATLQTQAITFNLGNAVLRDMAQDNIGLQPGDDIQLFTTTQMPTRSDNRNQLVSLMGEVMVPGKYQIRAGETLTELIQRAGGLSRNAYVFGTQFLRESIKQQQQDNIDRASQKMQAQIEAQAAVLKQSATEADKLQAQAQLVDQQQMLKRVSEIKASGRISLDLDPEKPLLPALTLTDGDSVFIPTRPGMVGVFGEVFTETSQIHRPGMTVGSTLTKAGVTKDADSDNILLIRADGTVISNASQTGWWGKSINHIKLQPGDSVYVPSMVDKRTAYSLFIQGAKDWTTILYQLSLGAVGIKTLRSD